MSDDDRDLELESVSKLDSEIFMHFYWTFFSVMSLITENLLFQAEKRAHHNALERKRRDHIKDSFTSLRESVPSLQGEKVVNKSYVSNVHCYHITRLHVLRQ